MQEIIAGLAQYDTATVFNALVLKTDLPNEEYEAGNSVLACYAWVMY